MPVLQYLGCVVFRERLSRWLLVQNVTVLVRGEHVAGAVALVRYTA